MCLVCSRLQAAGAVSFSRLSDLFTPYWIYITVNLLMPKLHKAKVYALLLTMNTNIVHYNNAYFNLHCLIFIFAFVVILIVVSVCTATGAWNWLIDPDTQKVRLWDLLLNSIKKCQISIRGFRGAHRCFFLISSFYRFLSSHLYGIIRFSPSAVWLSSAYSLLEYTNELLLHQCIHILILMVLYSVVWFDIYLY